MIAATHSPGTCFLLARSAYFQPIALGGRALDILIAD
jgi:hypothetical protein